MLSFNVAGTPTRASPFTRPTLWTSEWHDIIQEQPQPGPTVWIYVRVSIFDSCCFHVGHEKSIQSRCMEAENHWCLGWFFIGCPKESIRRSLGTALYRVDKSVSDIWHCCFEWVSTMGSWQHVIFVPAPWLYVNKIVFQSCDIFIVTENNKAIMIRYSLDQHGKQANKPVSQSASQHDRREHHFFFWIVQCSTSNEHSPGCSSTSAPVSTRLALK